MGGGGHCPTWMSLIYLVRAGHLCGGGGHCPTWMSLIYLVRAGHVWGRGTLSYMDAIDLSSGGRTLGCH